MFAATLNPPPPPLFEALPGEPSLPPVPDAAAPNAEAGPPTRFENLSLDLQMLLADTCLQDNRHTPGVDPVPVFAGMNRNLRWLYGQPLAASNAMRALDTARSTAAFLEAAGGLALVPRQYLGLCAETAWHALGRIRPGRQDVETDQKLLALVGALEARGQSAAWRRGVAFLLRRSAAQSVGTALELLRSAAADPWTSPRAWSEALRLIGQAMVGCATGPVEAVCAAVPPGARRAGLDTLLACVRQAGTRASAQQVRELVARIECCPCPHSRRVMFDMLRLCWPMLTEADHPLAQQALQGALMREEGGDREAALTAVPPGIPPAARTALLGQIDTLAPAAGLRVLTRHVSEFIGDSADPRVLSHCTKQLQGEGPASAEVVRETAALAARVKLRHRNDFLAMQELHGPLVLRIHASIAGLAAQERIAVLALLDPADLPAGAWDADWHGAVEAICRQPDRDGARERVLALLPGIAAPRGRGAVLHALHLALADLEPDARAASLAALARRWWLAPDGCSEAEFRALLDLCAGLPFYLREGPLRALARLAIKCSERCCQGVDRLALQTREAARVHATGTFH